MSSLPAAQVRYEDLASEVHLKYVTDSQPGFFRVKNGDKFIYYDFTGKRITDHKVKRRIDDLKIPPAWDEVWICPFVSGHLQATGRDEKGRKQYLYHPKWSQISNLTKFDKILYFSKVLPDIRHKVSKDMNLPGLRQEKILATIVWLLDKTYIRVGNEEYARENDHFGLTTLRSRHVNIKGSEVLFEFTGKSGKKHQVGISHPKVLKTIKKLEELPGYELFQYISEDGVRHPINSHEVNQYLKEIARDFVSAKDFRTWGGTVISALTLKNLGDFKTKKELRHNLAEAVCFVAKTLGNTPKICRNYYIHPTVVKSYQQKILIPHFEKYSKSKVKGLDKGEYATSILLKKYS